MSGFRSLFGKARFEQELDAELHEFIETAVDQKIRAGMRREEAIRAARMELGSIEAVKNRLRDVGWESVLETFWQDVRYAVRMLRRAPGFTTVAVATIALGIGGSTAIFTVVDSVLLRPSSFADPQRLTMIRPTSGSRLSPAYLHDWRLESTPVLLGRTFTIGADLSRAEPEVVLSHGFWQRRYGGDPGAIGQPITLDGKIFTIVGVMPEGVTVRTTESKDAPKRALRTRSSPGSASSGGAASKRWGFHSFAGAFPVMPIGGQSAG